MTPFRAAFVSELVKTGAPRVIASKLTPGSSNVRGYRYDAGAKSLFVTYKSGGTYRYDDVPSGVVKSLGRNKSAGKTINRLVKDKGYSYEKIGSGDMLQYFQDHPEKLKAKLERDKARHRSLKNFKPKGNSRERFIASRTTKKTASAIFEYFSQSRRWVNKLAGAAKRQTTFAGLPIKVEHDPGDVRSGTSRDGKTWERKMFASYGYVPGTRGQGADGEALDVYLAKDPVDGPVFEIAQLKKDDGAFDEHKYMIGWPDADAAKKAYLQHMPAWAFGSIKQVATSAKEFASSLFRKAA